jgi:hypothetical protein
MTSGVTLINENNYHQLQPFCYELDTGDVATSTGQSRRSHANADLKMSEVIDANPRTRTGTTREGETTRETSWCWWQDKPRISSPRREHKKTHSPLLAVRSPTVSVTHSGRF